MRHVHVRKGFNTHFNTTSKKVSFVPTSGELYNVTLFDMMVLAYH